MADSTSVETTTTTTTTIPITDDIQKFEEDGSYIIKREDPSDPYLLSELVKTDIEYQDFHAGTTAGELAFSSYQGHNMFLFEVGPVISEFGLSKWDQKEQDEKAIKNGTKKGKGGQQEKDKGPEYSLTYNLADNPELEEMRKWDAATIDYIFKNSVRIFGEEVTLTFVKEHYVPIVTEKKKKKAVPPQVKFKLDTNEATGLPAVEIRDSKVKLLYNHSTNSIANAEDAADRLSVGASDYPDPSDLLPRQCSSYNVIRHTGLYKLTGDVIGHTFRLMKVMLKELKRQRTKNHFRHKFVNTDAEKADLEAAKQQD